MGRRVLVTGASKGIGSAIAVQLARDGFDITVHYHEDRNGAERTLESVKQAGLNGNLIQFDVAAREECQGRIAALIAESGPFYGVVSNAGIIRDVSFPAMSGSAWDEVLRTDLDSFFNVVQPCVMPMVHARNGGRIVTMSSTSGQIGNMGQVNYSAAKAGIIGASKALAVELAKRRITVNCVAPGAIDTGMISGDARERLLEHIPARRLGTAEEVAGLVGYLMSDGASYITRQVISINGGIH